MVKRNKWGKLSGGGLYMFNCRGFIREKPWEHTECGGVFSYGFDLQCQQTRLGKSLLWQAFQQNMALIPHQGTPWRLNTECHKCWKSVSCSSHFVSTPESNKTRGAVQNSSHDSVDSTLCPHQEHGARCHRKASLYTKQTPICWGNW